jgi:hypothetical protein
MIFLRCIMSDILSSADSTSSTSTNSKLDLSSETFIPQIDHDLESIESIESIDHLSELRDFCETNTINFDDINSTDIIIEMYNSYNTQKRKRCNTPASTCGSQSDTDLTNISLAESDLSSTGLIMQRYHNMCRMNRIHAAFIATDQAQFINESIYTNENNTNESNNNGNNTSDDENNDSEFEFKIDSCEFDDKT